jgi:hypothetical protein
VPLDGGPLPEAAKRVDGDFGLLQGGANDVEAAVAEQKFEIGAAGLALAALDHEGKLDPRHRREEANRRIAERMCETLGVGFPQKDGDERRGIDNHSLSRHSAPHAGFVITDDLVRAAGVNIRQAAQCLPISISRSASHVDSPRRNRSRSSRSASALRIATVNVSPVSAATSRARRSVSLSLRLSAILKVGQIEHTAVSAHPSSRWKKRYT